MCVKIENNQVYVANSGIVDVNVEGITCIGDKLTASNTPGKARSIKYTQDETIFGIREIGKVINLYNDYSKVQVLINIK